MVLKQVPKAIIKVYFKSYPVELRLSKFNHLKKWKRFEPVLKELQAELFPKAEETKETSTKEITESVTLPYSAGVQSFDIPYERYACNEGDALTCTLALANAGEDLRNHACSSCGFPSLLPNKSQIKGQKGIYRIDGYLGRRGIGRIYRAIQTAVNQPVLIKECLLPKRYFNEEQIVQRKKAFKNLVGLSLADGRTQDSRFLQPLEAISDDLQERCYLIMDKRNAYPSLNQYLKNGAMTPVQVFRVLDQVLQTLEFLHTQKFRLPSGLVQDGIVHGNLSLDSLLLGSETNLSLEKVDFFIYLCDLGIWEDLFKSPLVTANSKQKSKHKPKQKSADLVDLGYIAFYLLTGKVVTEFGEPLEPRNQKNWYQIPPDLKQFILRLMELELPFENVSSARRELLKIPQSEWLVTSVDLEFEPEVETNPKFPRLLILLLTALGLGVIGNLVWLLFAKPQFSNASSKVPQPCCIKDIDTIPPGKFTYTAAENGIWEYIATQPNLIRKGETLAERLKNSQPKLNLTYTTAKSTDDAIAKVAAGEAAFTVVPLIKPLPNSLRSEIIAYDGLAVFVSFSYARRDNGLPQKLNGKITVEQLRQLYGGKVENWQKISAAQIPVKLYAPTDKETNQVMLERIFRNQNNFDTTNDLLANNIQRLPDIPMMRAVIKDFESNDVGGIGFNSISKIIGQCSVYPLALQTQGKAPAQPLTINKNKPINPQTDLCDRKGSIHVNTELFTSGRYPLAYSRDNDRSPIGEKFAQILKTREAQKLLQKTGLVPFLSHI